jgi:MoaA/NifB/PqqE/SkfB family radical SAM enzyme
MSAFKILLAKTRRGVYWRIHRSLYPLRRKRIEAGLSAHMQKLTIEISNICNANCIFCAYQYQTRPEIFMDMDLYKKVVREFAEAGGKDISFTPTVGDALTDKHFLERLRYAKQFRGLRDIMVTTNMISMHLHSPRKVIEGGLTKLYVSMSGFDEDMYKRVYRSTQYKRVMNNLRDFIAVNKELGEPVHITIGMRCDRPITEVTNYPDYKEIAGLIGDDHIDFNVRFDNWAGLIKPKDLSGTMKIRKPSGPLRWRISPCAEMYDGPMVYSNGLVGACGCRDVDANQLIIGDARTQHIADIWQGEALKKLRAEFLTDKIQPICKNCTHYYNLTVFSQKDLWENIRASENATAVGGSMPAFPVASEGH